MSFYLYFLSFYDFCVDSFHSRFATTVSFVLSSTSSNHLSCLNIIFLHEPCQAYISNCLSACCYAKFFSLRDRVDAFIVLACVYFCEDFNLAHFDAIYHVLLGDNKTTLYLLVCYIFLLTCFVNAKLILDLGQMHLFCQQILSFSRPRNAHDYWGM